MKHTAPIGSNQALAPADNMDLKPVLVVLLFSTSMLAGCFGEDTSENGDEGSTFDVYPEPWDRSDLVYDDQDIYCLLYTSPSPRDS